MAIRFDHIAIVVPDADQAASFFRRTLGFEVDMRRELRAGDDAWYRRHLPLPDDVHPEQLVVLRSSELVIECFQCPSTAAPSTVGALAHLGFVVSDLSSAVAAFEVAGAKSFGRVDGRGGARSWVMLETPWGSRIELVSQSYGTSVRSSTGGGDL